MTEEMFEKLLEVLQNNNSSFLDKLGTTGGTIISGVIVFVLCECLKEIWLSPLQEYKKLKSKISFALSYYAQYYSNVISYSENTGKEELYKNASDEMRKLSSELDGFIETLSWIKPAIPKKKHLYEASREIMGISNSFFSPPDISYKNDLIKNNIEAKHKIENLLKLYNIDLKKNKKRDNKSKFKGD